jgi:thiamine biosynthesis protein ThiS
MAEIEVILNGEKTRIPTGMTVNGLLSHLAIEAERVAVELNRELVRRPQWESCRIQSGDQLEIVHFVGGGGGRRR